MSSYTPSIELIGVYQIEASPNVHLIELIINVPPNKVDVFSFTQRDDILPRDSWQVPYDEFYLNKEGTKVIGRFGDQDKLSEETGTRIAFFMHYINFNKALLSQFGETLLLRPTHMPERLSKIINYVPLD